MSMWRGVISGASASADEASTYFAKQGEKIDASRQGRDERIAARQQAVRGRISLPKLKFLEGEVK